jgi:hypothetical protein
MASQVPISHRTLKSFVWIDRAQETPGFLNTLKRVIACLWRFGSFKAPSLRAVEPDV